MRYNRIAQSISITFWCTQSEQIKARVTKHRHTSEAYEQVERKTTSFDRVIVAAIS